MPTLRIFDAPTPLSRALACSALVLATACYSGVPAGPGVEDGGSAGSDGASPSAGEGGASGGQESGSDGATGGGDGGESACDGRVHVGASPLRRLTRREYNNTVRDLLGDASRPADAFVAEDSALGFNNIAEAQSLSPLLIEQYEDAADQLSTTATADLAAWLPCDPSALGEDACATQFIAEFGARALRRPLSTEEAGRYQTLFEDTRASRDFATAIRLVTKAFLMSPHFLYRPELDEAAAGEPAQLSDYEVASRLSYFLWNSMPDTELFAAAADGRLASVDGLEAEARRMLEDPRAEDVIDDFHSQWLELHRVEIALKDPEHFPEFSEDVAHRMAAQMRAYIRDVLVDGDARLQTLLLGEFAWVDRTLADYYGIRADGQALGDELQRVPTVGTPYTGLLSQGAMMAALASSNQTSPVHRGMFVRTQLLCQVLPPPPPDVDNTPPDPSPDSTMRERFSEHVANPECAGCHALVDPIGFGFEHFDGAGRYRELEAGLPVDASGEVVSTKDVNGKFNGLDELAQRLAQSEEVEGCVVDQWFRYANGRAENEEDLCTLERLRKTFAESDGDIRELLVAMVTSDAFRYRAAGSEE